MILFKNSLKSISVSESELIIIRKFGRQIDRFELSKVSKIYIKRKKISSFYFFDIFSFLGLILCVLTVHFKLSYLFFIAALFLSFRTIYLINTRSFFIHIRLKEEIFEDYYFSNDVKYQVLEKVKIVRGKLISLNFKLLIPNYNS